MDIPGSVSAALAVLPFSFMMGLALLRFAQGADRARAIVDAYLAWVILSEASTELFGRFDRLGFLPLLVVWGAANCWIALELWPLRGAMLRLWARPPASAGVVVGGFALMTLFIALTAAPSDFDAQTYQLPRIEHWIQDGALAFYPTSIGRQNEMAPLTQVLLLQTRILGGSDALYLLVQWASMLCSLAAVLRIARQLGGSETQSWVAVVFLATLPLGIVESTGTQDDYVVAALLAAGVTLGLEALSAVRAPLASVLAASAAVALSGVAKPTGWLLGCGFALWFAIGLSRRVSLLTWLTRAVAVAAALGLIVGPFASRYLAARVGGSGDFGLELGYLLDLDMRHADGGLDPVHPLLVLAALPIAAFGRHAGAQVTRRAYVAAWLAGIIAFAAVLLSGDWMIRVPLPALALAAPLVGLSWPERWAASRITTALILLLGLSGLPALLFNQGRELVPLGRDRPSYLALARDEKLFADRPQLLAPYRDAFEVIARSPASQIGLLLGGESWEYPLWRMLRDRNGGRPLRIEHVDPRGESRWPLGPFVPDLLFWNQGGADAPPMIELDGRQFTRVGPPATIAVFARVGLALN